MIDWSFVQGEGLALPSVAAESTGAGATVAIVDSGVNFDHPHLLLPARGLAVDPKREADVRDRLGHGTCCAALVHLLAPKAALFSVRVTDASGAADSARLAEGIRLAAEEGADVVLVALGTEMGARAPLDAAVEAALARGAVVVAADPRHGRRVLPAQSPLAIGVGHKDGLDVAATPEGAIVAEGRARPSPLSRNFWGSSLSAARAAAAMARCLEASKERGEALRRGFKKALIVL